MNGRMKMLLSTEARRSRERGRGNDYGNPYDNERPNNNYNAYNNYNRGGEMRDIPYYRGDDYRSERMEDMRGNEYRGGYNDYQPPMQSNMNSGNQYPPPVWEDMRSERRIGFDGGYGAEMHSGSRKEVNSRNTYFSGSTHRDDTKGVTPEKAEEWTKEMKNSDGTKGAHWSQEQTRTLMDRVGGQNLDPLEFYVAANMMYSDYCKTAKKFNVDNADFYGYMAKDFLEDKDAGKGKLAKYFEIVVDDD